MMILTYGEPGVGKTVFASTAADSPATSPVLFIDAEAGTLSIDSKAIYVEAKDALTAAKKSTNGKVVCVRADSWAMVEGLVHLLATQDHGYRTVVLDSVTEVNQLCLLAVCDDAKIEDPRIQDFGRVITRTRRMIRDLRSGVDNVIFVAAMQDKVNPTTKLPQKQPSLIGKLAAEICGFVDVVGLLEVEEMGGAQNGETERVLYVDASNRYWAKDRTEGGKLGGYLVNPTVPSLLALSAGKAK